MEEKKTIWPKIYIIWSLIAILLTFSIGKLNNDNITHIMILIILGLSLFTFRFFKPKNPKRFFILSCVFLAGLGEGTYMISKPVLDNLIIKKGATFGLFIHNYAIDLALTIPVYFLIFWVMWTLINKFKYTKWEYIFLMALGQAIGDGSSFFFLNPGLLLLIPFIMLNYHAMNVAPYLQIKDSLESKERSNSKWKYPITIFAIWATYFIGGTMIKIVAKMLGLE